MNIQIYYFFQKNKEINNYFYLYINYFYNNLNFKLNFRSIAQCNISSI